MSEKVKTHSNGRAAFLTVLICLLLGPIVGALLFAFWATVLNFGTASPEQAQAQTFLESILVFPVTAIFAIPFSFVLGGIQAIIGGSVLAFYGWKFGRPPWWVAIVASLGMALVFALMQTEQKPYTALLLFLLHVIPGMVCWWVVRGFWNKSL